ncbi:DUF4145 domain-containing protein [Patescibacteria group bacterium]|nr:DUF4145 domain-containing protein [Patescibacteria group bacterium]
MHCPYPTCQKDYNDNEWPKFFDDWINDTDGTYLPDNQKQTLNRIYLVSRRCHFCHQLFHEIYVGHTNPSVWRNDQWVQVNPTLELLATYPTSKTKFESKAVPQNIRDLFNEAERCRSIGAMTGVAACLRKTVYALCDNKKATGSDYKEKITNLPIEGDVYKELLKQIKFLGDNGTKPGGDSYSKEQIDIALTTLPIVIDKLYEQDEKIAAAERALAQVRSKGTQKQ